ncbi:hypothetical protein RRG08_038368 [Elysia crispata]|uniref:Uncharacterized protein n=1 Tax=Elysia crispata TaxID=231223 RepID=A0AAE0Z7Q4_9GAST|nr:hypothetical protein RRG08_038368 [Elysia crispata]
MVKNVQRHAVTTVLEEDISVIMSLVLVTWVVIQDIRVIYVQMLVILGALVLVVQAAAANTVVDQIMPVIMSLGHGTQKPSVIKNAQKVTMVKTVQRHAVTTVLEMDISVIMSLVLVTWVVIQDIRAIYVHKNAMTKHGVRIVVRNATQSARRAAVIT